MTTRRRNARGSGDRLREEIVAAALRLLDRTGREEALTLRAVAAEAGIAPQSMYLQFGDRDALLRAAADARYAGLRAATGSAADDPAQQLRDRCRGYVRWALEHPGQYQALFGVVGLDHPEWNVATLPGRDLLDALADAVAALGGTDPDRAALRLWLHLHGVAGLRIARPSFPWPPVEELVDDAIAVCAPLSR